MFLYMNSFWRTNDPYRSEEGAIRFGAKLKPRAHLHLGLCLVVKLCWRNNVVVPGGPSIELRPEPRQKKGGVDQRGQQTRFGL